MIEGVGARPLNLRMPQELPGIPGTGAAGAGAFGAGAPAANGAGSFAGSMEKFLGEVNDLQLKSAQALEGFARGETADMHRVVLAQQEASIALRLVSEMRDRLLQSYQEIMRMPV
jgi:flagellar hook-basal body complex protein FliE